MSLLYRIPFDVSRSFRIDNFSLKCYYDSDKTEITAQPEERLQTAVRNISGGNPEQLYTRTVCKSGQSCGAQGDYRTGNLEPDGRAS